MWIQDGFTCPPLQPSLHCSFLLTIAKAMPHTKPHVLNTSDHSCVHSASCTGATAQSLQIASGHPSYNSSAGLLATLISLVAAVPMLTTAASIPLVAPAQLLASDLTTATASGF